MQGRKLNPERATTMPRRPHEPSDEVRRQVEELSGRGVPQVDIAKLVGVSVPVLHREYRSELDLGMAKANALVAGRLLGMTEHDVRAAIFWAKCRLGFSERHQVEITGPEGGPVQIDAVTAVGALMTQLATQKVIEGSAE
jgi:hypothetical protein